MAQSDIPIILLAAGQSSRMRGRDKLLEPVDGVPLLRRQAEMACRVTSGPVLVTLPPAPHPRRNALDGVPVEMVTVRDAAEGMNASLRAGIAALPKAAPAAMVLLADLPDLDDDDLNMVIQSVDLSDGNKVWRGATSDGAAGHPIIFAASLFAAIARLHGDSGGREVVAGAQGKMVLVRLPGTRARNDLDTPEAWARWRAANPQR